MARKTRTRTTGKPPSAGAVKTPGGAGPATAAAGGDLSRLVQALPELYQPIFRHPELSTRVSRACDDRLAHILAAAGALAQKLDRPLRVLDLGCAQGYFSLHLAAAGCEVHGVDLLTDNIAVCRVLAAEFPELPTTFTGARLEEELAALAEENYDLVICLSVLHHLVHEQGVERGQALVAELATHSAAGIFELARRDEPLYWAEAQPEKPSRLLDGYAFVHQLASHPTHLSEIVRPLYFASNHFWYLDGEIGRFERVLTEPHPHAGQSHRHSRRYFMGEGLIVKVYRRDIPERLAINEEEHRNEINFLAAPPQGMAAPRMISHGLNTRELWLVREQLAGRLLSELFEEGACGEHGADRPEQIMDEVLGQLIALEGAGLYHNDVRCWNILIDPEGRAILFDYGAISSTRRDCGWPHNLFLAFFIFIRELLERQVADHEPFRAPWLNPDQLPEPYRGACWRFLALPPAEWSYSALRECLTTTDPDGDHLLPDHDGLSLLLDVLADGLTDLQTLNREQRQQGEQARATIERLKRHGAWLQECWDKTAGESESLRRQSEGLQQELALSRTETEKLREQSRWLQDCWDRTAGESESLRRRSEGLQQELALSRTETEKLREQSRWLLEIREQSDREAENLRQRNTHIQSRLEDTRLEYEDLRRHSELLQNVADAAQHENVILRRDLEQWKVEASRREEEVRAMQASTSWRLTGPLRRLSTLIRKPGTGLTAALPTKGKEMLRRAGRRVIAAIESRPALRQRLITLAQRFKLHNFLKGLYWRLMSSSPPNPGSRRTRSCRACAARSAG